MTTATALIQARMSSSRFPGKVIAPLGGLPMVAFMMDRVRRAKTIGKVAVITSTDSSDDPLVQSLHDLGLPVFRGDLHDVLVRYRDAADFFGGDTIVRLTGDCPLIDPATIDAVVRELGADTDYASNVAPPTYPDGLDVECFTRAALDRAVAEARSAPEREHVTLWMRGPASGLRLANHRSMIDASHLRLTVDYPEDLAVVSQIVEGHAGRPGFDYFDILRYLEANPHILGINRRDRNEGLAKSLADNALLVGAKE